MKSMDSMAFGGDYNPEQWSSEVWSEDLELMRRAGVTLITVGVFSWALIEPRDGEWSFDWLDEVLAGLHETGIAVDLATATASPPPWLTRAHPEILPVDADGLRLWPGARQSWCPSSPVFRERAVALADKMAQRYADHPALMMWHVSNELGGHNVHCYCDVSAAAFRRWLRERYGDLDALNDAWGTAFWSQRYSAWDEILPPRRAPTLGNPTQMLDFRRFSSDELLDHYRAERDAVRAHSSDVPITTNFMAMWAQRGMDYWAWAPEMDIVSNDHYLRSADPAGHIELALAADITRGLAGGDAWLLMEHSTSAVNWQPRNVAKHPGEMIRNSMQHVARGSDGAMFFQWRASRAGAEKYHSALVPHAGPDTKVYREVCDLGALLGRLGTLRGTAVEADIALVFDWQAWWACDAHSHPSEDVAYYEIVLAVYAACWRAGVTIDVVAPGAPLGDYALVLVPALHLVSDDAAQVIDDAVREGATALITFFSGHVDEHDHIRLGGYPGAFRELLGVWVEELHPLRSDENVMLDDDTQASLWTEHLHLRGAEAVTRYVDGPLPGVPALTRMSHGAGSGWYLATHPDASGMDVVVGRVLADAGIQTYPAGRSGLEVIWRSHDDGRRVCVAINHGDRPLPLPASGQDLVSGEQRAEGDHVSPGHVAVIVT